MWVSTFRFATPTVHGLNARNMHGVNESIAFRNLVRAGVKAYDDLSPRHKHEVGVHDVVGLSARDKNTNRNERMTMQVLAEFF